MTGLTASASEFGTVRTKVCKTNVRDFLVIGEGWGVALVSDRNIDAALPDLFNLWYQCVSSCQRTRQPPLPSHRRNLSDSLGLSHLGRGRSDHQNGRGSVAVIERIHEEYRGHD
jgi:hypothetical protein